MDLFKPSNKVLEIICSGKRDKHIHYNPLIFYEIILNQDKCLDPSFPAGLFSKIQSYYSINLNEETQKRLDYRKFGGLFYEAAKNCINHSSEGRNQLAIGYYFGNNGVCFGFNDEGDYFKDEKIKEQYENKIKITEFDENPFGSCGHHGVNKHIFPYSDMIEVDSEKGILYCVQFRENIIAPEGKEGNKYFWKRDKK